MRNVAVASLLAALALAQSGCFALYRGTKQHVHVTSDPPGAVVNFNGVTATTPCMLPVWRSSKPRMLRVEAGDRESLQVEVTSTPFESRDSFGAYMLLVVDVFFVIPALIDLAFPDAFYDWPKEMHVTLAPAGRVGTTAWFVRDRAREPGIYRD
ncbi:MAG: hypothetical protein KF878_04680 [Planctomycetes bacterium]|nr:hypothetical protein [Planctomycetota bacterium]